MSDENDGQGEETPSGLRNQLAEAAKQNRELAEELASFRAEKLVKEKGFHLVEPEDLKGVAASDLEAKAKEIHESRIQLQEKLLRDVLTRQGIEGDDLDRLVAQSFASKDENDGTADAARRVRDLGRTDSTPSPLVDASKLHGYDALSAYFETQNKSA